MIPIDLTRVLRTPHSERYVLNLADEEAAALELHFLPDGRVVGTFILFEGRGLTETDIPGILARLDEQVLPGSIQDSGNVFFTVVVGRVIGSFVPDEAGGIRSETPLN